MKTLTIVQLVAMTGGKLLSGDPCSSAHGVSTDTRSVAAGDVFIALRGDNFDGHAFLDVAVQKGASALVVSNYPANPHKCAVILVTDTLAALQNLARNYRCLLDCQIIAITGSNGKTSCKDLAATIIGTKFHVSKTQGNLNNHIGLPLSILQIEEDHEVAVLEIGMNHAGEIKPLAGIAKPNIVIITNIGVAHIEFLGSRDAIAAEKSLLAEAVEENGTVILNANDDYAEALRTKCRGRVITAGFSCGDVRVCDLQSGAEGSIFTLEYAGRKIAASLPLPGRHMVTNAALAAAAGLALNIPLQICVDALAQARSSAGRLQIEHLAGMHFLNDSYNANPDSMIAGLSTLREMPAGGQKIAVLGEMGELGTFTEEGYRKVGQAVSQLDLVIVVGPAAMVIAEEAERIKGLQVLRANDVGAAISLLQAWAQEDAWILVKGSRSARMERVVEAFKEEACYC